MQIPGQNSNTIYYVTEQGGNLKQIYLRSKSIAAVLRLFTDEWQRLTAGHIMVAVPAIVVPVCQQRYAIFTLATFGADKVVRLRQTGWAGVRPTAEGVTPNFGAHGGPNPAVGSRWLEFGVFTATEVANPATRPKAVDVGCKESNCSTANSSQKAKHSCFLAN